MLSFTKILSYALIFGQVIFWSKSWALPIHPENIERLTTYEKIVSCEHLDYKGARDVELYTNLEGLVRYLVARPQVHSGEMVFDFTKDMSEILAIDIFNMASEYIYISTWKVPLHEKSSSIQAIGLMGAARFQLITNEVNWRPDLFTVEKRSDHLLITAKVRALDACLMGQLSVVEFSNCPVLSNKEIECSQSGWCPVLPDVIFWPECKNTKNYGLSLSKIKSVLGRRPGKIKRGAQDD